MEEKDNEAKRARTVRYEYHRDVEQVQSWICQAEGRVQDRNLEPQTLKEFLQELQCEIGLITDQMDRVSRHGQLICQRTRDEHEQQLVRTTLSNLTDQLQQVRSWLEEKRLQVGDSIDSWQRFLQLHALVIAWVDEKKGFLGEPLHLISLVQARQKSQDYNMAVKSCKVATKNVSDMGKELSRISQVSSVGALADQMAEAEQSKTEVETQLQERSALLQEMTEEWEQCEKKLKDVKSWLEKARQTLDSPLNKKRPLRDQLSLREKMLGDVTIQKTKINMSIEKLQVHFRSGVTGSPDVVHNSTELIEQLDALLAEINQQCKTLEAAVLQLDQLQQEIQGLRAQVVQVDQQLRMVSSPTYSPLDRDKALAEQNALQSHLCSVCQQIQQLRMRMTEIDPYLTLADDGIERSLMAAAADWQSRAPMEPSHPAPHPPPQTSTDVQSIPPPRCDDVQSPVRETISTSTTAAALKNSALLTLEKFSYADIAAGRRSPSVSRQTTFESHAELVEPVSEPVQVEPPVKLEIQVPQIQETLPGRSRWEQQQQEKLVQSDDPAAETKHPSRSDLRRRAAGGKQKRSIDQESNKYGSQDRHPPVTPAESFDVQVQEEPVIEEVKMVQEAVQETGTRPKVATTERRSSSNLSPPSDSEKRSRSPLWMPGSGGPSYADILRGHYIPHHQRGMTGIVDIPQQQQQQKQEQLRRCGGDSIDDTNMADEAVVPAEDHSNTQQPALPEVIEEPSPVTEVQEQTQLTTVEANWAPHQHAVYDEPIQQQQVGYPESMFQPSNLSFETQYASAPDAEAVFAANFDLMALQQAYAQLEYGNLPVAYPLAAFPIQQTVNVPQNFTFNVEQPRQEFTTSTPTPTAPQIQEPEVQVIAATPVQQTTADAPVEVTKPVATNVTKLSYAQILAAGLREPESPHRRDSSGSAGSGCTSSSPRPSQATLPNVSDKAATDSAPSPSRLSVPERGVSEPREPRSRQRISKGSKSKSFDVREKDPSSSKPKSPHGASKLATLPGRSMEAKTRPKKKARNASFNEDKEWTTPVSVQVSPPPQESLMPPEPSQARSKSPGGNPPTSEPEMTKAMMTFYGISSEDIEQLISSRSQDSDSDAEAAGVEATTEKKKKHLQKKKKRKSSKVPDEDEIEKALREISELERTKKSKMRRTPSHEIKSSIPEVQAPEQKPQKVQSVNLEVPEPKKREKKLKKAASVSGGHPDKSTLKPDSSPQPLTEASTGCDSATSSSGSPDSSTHKQRRDRIKRAKTVSFNEESLNKCEPAPVTESQVKKASPKAEPEKIGNPVEPSPENEAEFVVLNSQGLESVGHLVADVESLMEDAMSDDIVVLETENLATSPGPIEGHRTLDPQILEDVFTETASVFESHVCPEIYEEEECVPVAEDPLKEEAVAISSPAAVAEQIEKEIPASEAELGPLNVAKENNDEKIPVETTEELPLGSQPAAAMTLLPLEVRVTLRKISATSTVPFQPEELELRADETPANDQLLRATESIDLEPAALEITSAMIFDNHDIETVGELEQDTESPVLNAETAGIDILTCISAITHSPPVEMITAEQLPILARQVSLAEEEYADESELSLPPATTPIPAMQEREEEALTLATMEEPPTTKMYVPAVEQELPSQEQMVDIVEALLEEPEANLPEESVIETPATVHLSAPVEALPTEPFPAENPTEVSAIPTTAGTTQSAIVSVPLLTETPPEAVSVSSPGSDNKAPSSPFGFDDADHVVLSPQWMRQRSPLGRTFSLDPRNLSTALKSTPASPLVKAHSTDLSESYGTEEQKAAAAKNLEEGSKSESQTGGEADDEDVEVYWRLREKKKKKKRRNPITAVAGNPPRVSESSSDALSMADPHGPMSPLSVGSDLPVSESTLTSDDEHRTKCTQDDGFQSGISTPVLLSIASPDSELPETPTELESVSVAVTETLLENPPITAEMAVPSDDIDTLSQSTLQEEDIETEVVEAVEKVETEANEITPDMPILAGPCLLIAPETSEELQQQIPSTTEDIELLEQTTPAFEESSISFDSPATECLEPVNEPEAISVPASQATSWANLVATGKPKITDPTPEPEPAPRPPRPLPTLIVVGEEEHHDVPCDPEGFHIGRKERKWRKWRSSQSESQDVASDAEHVETPSEAPVPSMVEEIMAVKQVPPPSPAENSSSESNEEMAEPIRVVVRSKVQKMAKSVRELEQRKRRSRLSESEQEVLELAEAIDANKSIPSVRPQKDDNLRNIYLDSWPKCPASTLDNSEKCLWILQQSSGQKTEASNDVSETVALPSEELIPIEENTGETEKPAEAIPSAEVLETGEKEMEQTQLVEPEALEKNVEIAEPCQEVEEQKEQVPLVEAVILPDETTENKEIPQVVEDLEKETVKEEPCHPSVLSWATVVATSKPVITETKEEEEEPVRPKRPLPTLIVVGESEQPVVVQTDPDSFTEFVCRSERRRRKWRSSQSESQDYTTDEEHGESVSKDKPEEQTIASEPVETIAEDPVTPSSTDVVKESDEEEVHEVPSARPKERKTKTPKALIPLKETEQRRRRARLSESEKESLDLAEAIEHGDPIPVLYQNLHADSWPQHTTSNSENLLVALQQSSQTTEASDAIPEVAEVESVQLPESKLPDLENLLGTSEQLPETIEASDAIPKVAENQSIQGEPSQVMDECKSVPAEVLTEPVEKESVVQPETMEDIVQQIEEQQKEPVESKHPSVMSWATVVATSKPVITESKEEVVEEPVRPKRPLPTLIVVGDGEQPVPVETDPDSFTEFVCRNERRRRKWRSSQSESQDYTTDEEHVESVPLVVEDKSKEQPIDPEPIEATVQAPVTSAPVKPEEDVSDEEVHDVLPARPKERKTKTAKASIPLKETEQRRRRARLSESERESLELAEVIEHGETTPQLYYDLFADSWPHPFYIFLREAESRWKAKESLMNQPVVTDVQVPVAEPIQEASQIVPQETVCQPNQEPTPELIPESVQEWVPEPSALQEEQSTCPPAEVLEPTADETPVISGWVIRESPEKKVPDVAKPLSWAAMVALSKAAAIETVPEPVVEQVTPRPTKTPVLVVVGEEIQPEPISSDDPDGFHECVSRRERRRRKWRSSQSESQDTEADVPEASLPTDLPSEPSYVNVKVENVSTHPSELHEKSESKSKRVVVKIEKQTKEVERKRSKRLSESEREALQLAEAIESGQDITNKCPVVESYWSDKMLYSDAEKLWQESLNGAAVRLDDKIEKQSQSPDPKGPIPQPQTSDESSNSSSRLPTTENISNIDLPEDRAICLDESAILSESQRQQNVHKKELSTDLDAMLAQLQQVEKDLQQFNSQQIQDRLPLIEAVMESLEEMEPRLIDLDDRIKNLLDEDPELDSLRAAVASLRTRHITLESQACRYKQKLEDAAEAKSKDNEDLLRYQALLSDLDEWVSVTHYQLKAELPKFTSVGAVLKEMDSSKRLEQDIVKRNEQLADLMKRCGALQHSVAETEPLATQLYEHLCALQRSFSEAGAQLHTRLLLLQACLLELEAKEVDISPVQHVDHEATHETPVTASDTPVATAAPEVRLNDPIEHKIIPAQASSIDEDNEMSFTQSVVQKTVRVIRRTVLQNGREISVEEQIEEKPTSGVTPLSVETELVPPKRYFRIPSPFGIVEEPNFHDDQRTEKDVNKSTVEITDITDEYDDRETANIGPTPDQFIEIHEVLDNLQFVEQPQSPEKIIELSSSNDGVTPQNQPRLAFETLHEHEEEHDESTEFNPVDTKADDDDEPVQHGQLETERDIKDVLQESEISQTVEMLIEPQVEPILEANPQKDLDAEKSHELGSEVQPELEVTSRIQKLDEITSELQADAQQEPLVVCEEAVEQQVETSMEPENERTVDPNIEHELCDEVQQTEIEITPPVITEEKTAEPTVGDLVEEHNEAIPEPEVQQKPIEEKTFVEIATVDHREVQAVEPTNLDDRLPIETSPDSREDLVEESNDKTIGEPDLACEATQQPVEEESLVKVSEVEIFEKEEATMDHQEKQAVEPAKMDDEIETSPDTRECPVSQIELTTVSSTEPTSIIAEIPFDEAQQLEAELSQQPQIPETQSKTVPETESQVEVSVAAEPVKDELPVTEKTKENVPVKVMEKVKTTISSTTSSVGDETESDVDNMDWNVSPDDERQFDEYFKDERPPSASSNSSTSTDTTRLESASCEPVEDIPLQGTDTVDSSRATPIQEEAVHSDTESTKENQPEEEINNQTANDVVQEHLDSPVEVLALEVEDSSAQVEVEDVSQIPVEEQTSVVDESVLDPIYVVETEDESSPESISWNSNEKMPTELAEQLSQQLVEEVFKSVETHPTIERMIQESLMQSAMADPSSSSESSSSQEDGGWWMVDPEDTKQEVKEPFEMVEELQSPLMEPAESTIPDEDIVQQQQLVDNNPSTTSESQLTDVESLIVQSEPDLLPEMVRISDLTSTELSNVTVIRVGYGDEPPIEEQQVAGTSFIEPLEKSEDTLKREAEVQQAIETLSPEPTKASEQDILDKEVEEQQTSGTPLTEQVALDEDVEEQQTLGTEATGYREQDTLDIAIEEQQVIGTPTIEPTEDHKQDTLDEEIEEQQTSETEIMKYCEPDSLDVATEEQRVTGTPLNEPSKTQDAVEEEAEGQQTSGVEEQQVVGTPLSESSKTHEQDIVEETAEEQQTSEGEAEILEEQQVAETPLVEPFKERELNTFEEEVEEQQICETEPEKICDPDVLDEEPQELQVIETPTIESTKSHDPDTLDKEIHEQQTLGTEPIEDSVQVTMHIEPEEQQVIGKSSVEPLESSGQSDEEQQVVHPSSDSAKVIKMGEKILEILPGIVEQLSNIETLIEDVENDPLERSQSQEEESTKERGDEWNTLTEHRESVAPTLGENTTGPPIDDVQIMEQVARLVSDRVTMGQEAQQEELNTEWQEIQKLLDNRLSSSQSAESSTHTSSVRYLATVTQVTVHETVEERTVKLNDNLAALKTAVQRREVVVIQQIVITIVRTVTEWLETIEYRVYTIKQTKSMERRTEQIQSLCEEVRVVEECLNTLEEITEMAVEVVNEDTKILLHKCVKSLKQQVQSVSEVTKRSEGEIEHIRRQWAEYLDQISNEEDRIKELMHQLRMLQSAEELPSQEKLVQLEDIETAVQERLEGVTQLLHSGHELVKETPFYQMPESAYALLDTIKNVEETVRDERNVLLHKAALTAEYRQTLQEFAEIVRLSEALSDSKLAARNPPEASQELEKRQRFLFCLSHFLQVLDTLEPHLDLDTRSLCQDLHAELVVQAGAILDRAVNRQEIVEMTLASWNLLELQWAQEDEWFRQLQIPDISNIRSEMIADLTESIKDVLELMEHHRSVAAQLVESTRSLDCLFSDPGLEVKFQERIVQLQQMINDTRATHRQLLLSAEHWNQFREFASHIEPWLAEATAQLQTLVNKAERGRVSHEDCLQYWVVRTEAEEKQQEWVQAKMQLDRAIALVSVTDEDENRRFCVEIDESWIQLDRELQCVEKALLQGLAQQEDIPLEDRLICIECSHARIQSALDQLPVKYGSPEEATTRRKELQAFYNFTEWQLKEISALGASNPHLAADRAEHLGVLARRTKEMTNAISQRLERIHQVHQWMISFQRLYSVTSRRLQEVFICLQKASIYRDPLWLAQAAQLCEESERELQSIDVESAKLQRHLEVCPKDGVTAVVDETSFLESLLQLDRSRQRSRDLLQLTRASVADRLDRWKLFENSVNRVLSLIKRLKYARNMASLKGSVDLQRLLTAKQSIETIHEELTTNQHLVSEVGRLAEPFEPQAGETAADIAVQWTELESSLERLSHCYGHAAADWMGIEAELDDIQQWCSIKLEWTQHSVTPGEEDETLAQIQAIGEELLVQQERLERSRLAASELGRSIAMGPVVVDNSISMVGADANSAAMPVSLASTAEHVAQQLQLLQQSMTVLADIAERQSNAFSNCNGTILSAEKLINTARQTLCTVEEDAAGERIEDQLVVLRDQLLQLSPTEQQLNSAPISEQLPAVVEIRPQAALCATTSTIQTTLQQWEIIFQKTFAEYERLLNKLQDRCDESATAQVWRDHLDQAEKYLSRSLPDQYLSTCEDRDLCELHENLLIRHHSVFQSTQSSNETREVEAAEATEEVIEPKVACNLQGLHRAVLARIRLRHAALSDRALAWEQYRSSLSKLLTWLDAAERERKHLVLRQIQEHGLPTALHRVEVLLDKIGQGHRIQVELDRAARQLLEKLGEEESATTVRADLKSAAARLTDLDAGLRTWRDFLERVARLYQNLEKGVEGIRQQLQSVQSDLVAENELPSSTEAVSELLQHYREQLLMVQTLSSDVEKQEVVAGEIRSCVNIPDAKRIWQRLAALQIRRCETEDRLNSLIQMLEDQQDWPKVFEMRYARFVNWASTMEQRLLQKQRALVDDMVQRLSGPLRDELAAKESEHRWLVDQGKALSLVCGNQERKDETLSKVANVEEIWKKLMETWNHELQRLQQLPTDLDGLNNSLAELTVWLGQTEAAINAPLTISACNSAAVESRLAEHRNLEQSIEQKRPIVASVLDLCNSFTVNYTLLHGWLGPDLDAVQYATQSLQRRWKSICQLASERSALLQSLWPDWSAVLELHGQLDQIMSVIELATPKDTSGASSSFEVEQLSTLLENLIQELHAPLTRQKLDQLNERYCILARDGRLDAAGELQQMVARLNARWRDLSDRLSTLLQTSRNATSLIHHWQGLRDRLLVWCSHCEVQVQQLESNALSGESDPAEVLRQLAEDLQVLENARAEIRELGRALIKQGTVDMQSELDDYLKTEDVVLLKMAQMQVQLAERDQERQMATVMAGAGAQNFSMCDSGVYSYPLLDNDAPQGSAKAPFDDSAISLSLPDARNTSVSVGTSTSPSKLIPPSLAAETRVSPTRTATSPSRVTPARPVEEVRVAATQTVASLPKVPPARPIEEIREEATGAKQRTYAEVAKTAVVSSTQRLTPPPVSIKSDTQRHLELALDEWRQRLARLDHLIKTSISTEPSTDAANEIARMVATCRSSHDLTQHLCSRLVSESSLTDPRQLEALTRQTSALQDEFQQLEMLAKSKERNLRDERKTWAQQEQDLWRLERWLEHAENQFRAHERIPTNMEQLEDTVQDFRELSLDLDSHKNIVMSLNIVVNHVAEHAVTADQRAADRLRSRLAAANSRWDAVCKSAARIQGRLQSSLMQNEEYHRTIRDLVSWLERTEADIQSAEPIDLTVGNKQLKAQLTKFQDLYAQLSQFEPRVTSMREIADQVFAQSVEADSAQLRSKLAVLNDRLTSLLKICGQYKQLLDGALRNRGASASPSTPSGLNLSGMSSPGVKSPRPSVVVLPSTESPCRSPSPRVPRASSMDERSFTSTVHSNFAAATASARTPDREESNGSAAAAAAVDTSVLQRGYRFFGRVIRTALPIQAVMLLVLGVASLVPNNNSCMDANTFVDSLEFVLGYPDGAPPT